MSESKPKAAPKAEPKTETVTVTVPPVVYSPDEASGYLNPKPKEKK